MKIYRSKYYKYRINSVECIVNSVPRSCFSVQGKPRRGIFLGWIDEFWGSEGGCVKYIENRIATHEEIKVKCNF